MKDKLIILLGLLLSVIGLIISIKENSIIGIVVNGTGLLITSITIGVTIALNNKSNEQ